MSDTKYDLDDTAAVREMLRTVEGENIEKILGAKIETDEDYAMLGMLVTDESESDEAIIEIDDAQ